MGHDPPNEKHWYRGSKLRSMDAVKDDVTLVGMTEEGAEDRVEGG